MITVNGKQHGFLMTVGAQIEISNLCPAGNIKNLGEIFLADAPTGDMLETTAKIIAALSEGYERSVLYAGGEPSDPIAVDELLSLDLPTFRAVQAEALKAFRPSTKIELEGSKKNVNPGI